MATERPFKNDAEVLNYALSLEHLEATFYRDAVAKFDNAAYTAAGFETSVRDNIAQIAADEKEHVAALIAAITQLKGTPVKEATYDFGYTDLPSFLATAAAIEGVGVSAYTGAVQYVQDNDALVTTALGIQVVEARHSAYLNQLTDANPFPSAANPAATPEEVLKTASKFIKS
jgi:hypothetical protein